MLRLVCQISLLFVIVWKFTFLEVLLLAYIFVSSRYFSIHECFLAHLPLSSFNFFFIDHGYFFAVWIHCALKHIAQKLFAIFLLLKCVMFSFVCFQHSLVVFVWKHKFISCFNNGDCTSFGDHSNWGQHAIVFVWFCFRTCLHCIALIFWLFLLHFIFFIS